MIQIASFFWPHEYLTLKAFLEDAGIDIYMLNETMITIDPLLSNAMGGIKMMVPEEQAEEATKLIAIYNQNLSKETSNE